MSLRGAGDRWLAGDKPPGVLFLQNDSVEIVSGPESGERGAVILLLDLGPDPLYLVELGSGRGDRNVRQSALRALE